MFMKLIHVHSMRILLVIHLFCDDSFIFFSFNVYFLLVLLAEDCFIDDGSGPVT